MIDCLAYFIASHQVHTRVNTLMKHTKLFIQNIIHPHASLFNNSAEVPDQIMRIMQPTCTCFVQVYWGAEGDSFKAAYKKKKVLVKLPK